MTDKRNDKKEELITNFLNLNSINQQHILLLTKSVKFAQEATIESIKKDPQQIA